MKTGDDPDATKPGQARRAAQDRPATAPSATQEPEQPQPQPSISVEGDDGSVPTTVMSDPAVTDPVPEVQMVYSPDAAILQAMLDRLVETGGFPQSVSCAPDGGFWTLTVRMPE